MRLWYQSMTPLSRLRRYESALRAHAAEVCSPGVEVAVHGVSDAPYRGRAPGELLKSPYAKLVLQVECIEAARRAEREGYDAFILGSFSEPFLPEIRSLLEVPVVSMAEATMLVACSLSEQFALVTIAAPNAKRLRAVVKRHGMDERVIAVRHLAHGLHEAELDAALAEGDAVVDDFMSVARAAVEAGADVVVPAEGVLNEIVHRRGVRSIAEATVLDCVGTSFLYAEMMVQLRQRLGVGVGRRWAYTRPSAEVLAHMKLVARFDPPR